jgi:hypothetical protein
VINTPHQSTSEEGSSTSDRVSVCPLNSSSGFLRRIWQSCVQMMTSSYELKVWQKVDRQGRLTSLQVFDPESDRSISFGSEMEFRLWLEKRHYR